MKQSALRAGRFRLITVMVVALLGVSGTAVGITNEGVYGPMTVVAEFDDASPLLVGNDVKVHGVKVGEVADMVVTEDNTAKVLLSLERAAMPVHSDATATVRPVSLLGERFVDLQRGSPKAPLLEPGDTIGLKQTAQAPDLDQVLNTIDDPTGQSLAALVTVLGDGLAGNGKNVDAALRSLASSMNRTRELAEILGEQNQLITGMVTNLAPVADALAADDGAALDRLVSTADTLLGTTAANQEALDRTLSELPGTLSEARRTLSQLTGVADETTPNLRALRPVTENLVAISEELRAFADTADPALASATPVLRRAKELIDQARPVVEQLKVAGPDLQSLAADAKPLVRDLTKNLGNVLNFVRYWALTTNGYDGLSHYFRAMIVAHPEIGTSLVPVETPVDDVTEPTDGDDGTVPLPKLDDDLPDVGGLLAPESSGDDGVTGLNEKQEGGILRFLIGGGS